MMEPTLGMRYEPHQLKLALANYGVAHGYQLWVMKNKVMSGVQKGVKKKVAMKKVVKKKVVKKKPISDSGERTSQSPKWTKKQVRESKQVVCPFRRKAQLDSNPGSTCRLDVDEYANGSATFKRIYICFKRVKDAMGRDANNQMYHIAWAVVRVENADN
ncbi:hypothetical protein Tco_1551525 [Tanacetum coccineum]